MTQAEFKFRRGNPDVLTSIANLSNDEVFTPPEFANRMLDTLEEAWASSNNGANIWEDSTVTFLDPFTKSGVFLREITKRLTHGLEKQIPDLQERVNHILTKQVFGIAITQLTALLARRSVYCSKWANGEHSIVSAFDNPNGNIWFERTEHTWVGGKDKIISTNEEGIEETVTTDGKCKFCGAKKTAYHRGSELETHAYLMLHTVDVKATISEIFGAEMKFDVVIGNPPYQLETEADRRQAKPIYNLFIEQAKSLDPNYLVMVTPSRWMLGGMGLGKFRQSMLADQQLRKVVDFIVDRDVFPSINANGGISYFLWQSGSSGDCIVQTVLPGGTYTEPIARKLDEFDVFIRYNQAITILRKVQTKSRKSFSDRVYPIGNFGFPTNFHGNSQKSTTHTIKLYGSKKISWISRSQIQSSLELIDSWKVLIPGATDGNEVFPLPIWDAHGPFVAGPDEVSTWTYLVASKAASKDEAINIALYMRTKFFRFLVSLRKVAQHNKAENFVFVPDLDFSKEWTDEKLFMLFGLDEQEIEFIESQIRTLTWGNIESRD